MKKIKEKKKNFGIKKKCLYKKKIMYVYFLLSNYFHNLHELISASWHFLYEMLKEEVEHIIIKKL